MPLLHHHSRPPRCGNCGRRVARCMYGQRVYVGYAPFGAAVARCRRCKKYYKQRDMWEAALYLCEHDRVSAYIGSKAFLYTVIIAFMLMASLALAASGNGGGIALVMCLGMVVAVFAVSLVVGVLTLPIRQWYKNRLVRKSRERLMTDDDYLACLMGHRKHRNHKHTQGTLAEVRAYRAIMGECFRKDEPLPVHKLPKLLSYQYGPGKRS